MPSAEIKEMRGGARCARRLGNAATASLPSGDEASAETSGGLATASGAASIAPAPNDLSQYLID